MTKPLSATAKDEVSPKGTQPDRGGADLGSVGIRGATDGDIYGEEVPRGSKEVQSVAAVVEFGDDDLDMLLDEF